MLAKRRLSPAPGLGNEETMSELDPPAEIPGAAPGKALSAAARRALQEAEARRQEVLAQAPQASTSEIGGPQGLEPTRFGDWERKGIAVDF
jgi:hypothetical protein